MPARKSVGHMCLFPWESGRLCKQELPCFQPITGLAAQAVSKCRPSIYLSLSLCLSLYVSLSILKIRLRVFIIFILFYHSILQICCCALVAVLVAAHFHVWHWPFESGHQEDNDELPATTLTIPNVSSLRSCPGFHEDVRHIKRNHIKSKTEQNLRNSRKNRIAVKESQNMNEHEVCTLWMPCMPWMPSFLSPQPKKYGPKHRWKPIPTSPALAGAANYADP